MDVAVLGGAEQAVAAVDDVFDLERAGQRGEDDAGGGGDFGGRAGPGGAEFEQVLGDLRSDVVDDKVVTGFDQVSGHGVADVACADESYFADRA